MFDAYSPFYNDICTPFTNENGNDVLLDDRRNDYYDENIKLCGKDCVFIGYNTKSKTYTCQCNVKGTVGVTEDYKGEVVERKMPDNFKDLISKRSNIEVFKCSSQVFSSEGQKKNFGSYILLVCLAAIIGVGVFHFNANPPKNGEEGKKDRTKIKDAGIPATSSRKVSNRKYSGKIDFSKEDDYINFADYNEVKGKDKRNFLQTYWSYLKFKQSIIFTFYTDSIGILRSSKIVLFVSFVAFYMAFTALFFNDSIMRKLYIYKGNTNAAVRFMFLISFYQVYVHSLQA